MDRLRRQNRQTDRWTDNRTTDKTTHFTTIIMAFNGKVNRLLNVANTFRVQSKRHMIVKDNVFNGLKGRFFKLF